MFRFFFLSNDELLEILSETKDPLRVQPHVKKCFEGIEELIFQADKNGNQDVIGMKSSLDEKVEFSSVIYPADAKGMVEKWLQQVEKLMIKSLKDIIAKCVPDYETKDFGKWVTDWPGQAILCARGINWTSEVTNGLVNNNLKDMMASSQSQLDEIVAMVRNGLSPAVRSTVVSLIVLDVHAKYASFQLRSNQCIVFFFDSETFWNAC